MSMNNIAILDTSAAERWVLVVEQEMEETKALLTECGKAVQAVNESASGSIIDDLYHHGANFLENVVKVTSGVNEITGAIKGILKGFKKMFK